MKVCVGVKSTKFGELWDENTEPSIRLTTYEGVETRHWNLLRNIICPRKVEIYLLQELQTLCKNILRYSPNYTKEEGIESKDKEP